MRYHHRIIHILTAGVLGLLVVFFGILQFSFPPNPEKNHRLLNSTSQKDTEDFFKIYWQRPIPLQGSPPHIYTEKEASLKAEDCGSCHPQQYADWKESLHSKAMGPGPWGQIIELIRDNPEEASECMSCHAPLSEQSPFVTKTIFGELKIRRKNPAFNFELQHQGISCSGCHVRYHQRFGPPARLPRSMSYPSDMPNHSGVQRTPLFEKSQFCRDCHQFDPEKSLLVNGKPLQDTYREWKNSIWGQAEAHCQQCHMPDRRHFWKGIHDPEWVKSKIQVAAEIQKNPSETDTPVKLTVAVTNAGGGHKFPTYITPKVFIRAELLNSQGEALPETQQETTIGWDARFEKGQWKEYFDTRIPPAETFKKTFQWTLPPSARKVRAWVEVYPDHFYHVHFYPAYLQKRNLSIEGKRLIEEALHYSGSTHYTLFENVIPLN